MFVKISPKAPETTKAPAGVRRYRCTRVSRELHSEVIRGRKQFREIKHRDVTNTNCHAAATPHSPPSLFIPSKMLLHSLTPKKSWWRVNRVCCYPIVKGKSEQTWRRKMLTSNIRVWRTHTRSNSRLIMSRLFTKRRKYQRKETRLSSRRVAVTRGPSTPVRGQKLSSTENRFESQNVDMYISGKGPTESHSDRRCLCSLCLRVLQWPGRDVWMCQGRRCGVCAVGSVCVSVRFLVCVHVRVRCHSAKSTTE